MINHIVVKAKNRQQLLVESTRQRKWHQNNQMMILFLNHHPTTMFFQHHLNIIAMKRNQELLSKSFLLDDTVTPLVRSMKSASFSTQENGDNERTIYNRRRPSVLDEKALREDDTKLVRDQRINAISESYQGILESIGEDPTRQGEICIINFIIYFL